MGMTNPCPMYDQYIKYIVILSITITITLLTITLTTLPPLKLLIYLASRKDREIRL